MKRPLPWTGRDRLSTSSPRTRGRIYEGRRGTDVRISIGGLLKVVALCAPPMALLGGILRGPLPPALMPWALGLYTWLLGPLYVAIVMRALMPPGWRRYRRVRLLLMVWGSAVVAPGLLLLAWIAPSEIALGLLLVLAVILRRLARELERLRCPGCRYPLLVRNPTGDGGGGAEERWIGYHCMRCGVDATRVGRGPPVPTAAPGCLDPPAPGPLD